MTHMICTHFGIERADIELHFVRSPRMKELNQLYRGKNKPTDILSFASDKPPLFGSLVIDVDTAKRQAKEFGHPIKKEIEELFIHGVLHLFGFDHERADEAEIMSAYEYYFRNQARRRR